MMKRILFGLFACLLWSQSASAVLSVNNMGDVSVDASAGSVIVVFVAAFGGTSVTSVSLTTAGLSFTKRTAVSAGSFILEEWYAIAGSAIIADSWNITYSTGVAATFQAYVSLSGANTSTPFDVNGALPALGSNMTANVAPSLSVSTTNANTIILSALVNTDTTVSGANPAAGFTTISFKISNPRTDAQYKIVSATQSSFSVTWGAADTNTSATMAMIADAVQAAGGGAATTNKNLMMMGVGQ